MTDKTEQISFEKIRNGDSAAFNLLFDKFYVALCFFANKYLADIDLARSLVQQVFVDLWTRRDKIAVVTSVKSYLFATVRNRCIDVLRKEKSRAKLPVLPEELGQTPFRDLVEEAELNDRINAAINKLPVRCREIFLLCRFEGLKYSEIAEKLGISVKTVEMQMGIALKKLRDNLSDYQIVNLLVFIYSKKN